MFNGIMISFDQALAKILRHATPLSRETVRLTDATGRFLAESIIAAEAAPRFDQSNMDGFGVRLAEVRRAGRGSPIRLPVSQIVAAGGPMPSPLQKGTAVKVFTGAPLPRGVEAVIMKEFCVEQGAHVLVTGPVARDENIRRRGCEYARGATLLKPGTPITPPVAGLLASLGRTAVRVHIRPRVALVITGNELATPGRTLRAGQVYESNSFALASALQGLGLRPISSRRVRDNKTTLAVALDHALGLADVVITSGGVSVGEFDLVKEVAGELGVRTGFWRAAIKPGMPVYFGIYRLEIPTKTATKRGDSGVRHKLVFGLPGNPVSALVVFHQLVQPALQQMMGQWAPQRLRLQARLATPLRHNPGRLEWVRGVLEIRESALWVLPTPCRQSHMLTGLANARVLIEFPASATTLCQGSTVWAEWLQWG